MLSKQNETNGRNNVGRIDHSVLIYRNRENQEKARQQFSLLLSIDDWVDYGEMKVEGVHPVVSWKAGLELIYPIREIPIFEQHLAKHGEGFYNFVFGVADLDHAIAHLMRNGRTVHPLGRPPEGVFRVFEVAREATVGKVGDVNVTLGEFKPID